HHSPYQSISKHISISTFFQSHCHLLLQSSSQPLQYQEKPFSCPGFSFPSWQEPGLPTASMGFRKWRCLCSGDRLLLARNAFSVISEYFQLIQDDQLSLNPGATDLHQLLEATRLSSEAVLRNLITAFETLGFQPPPLQPDTLSWTSAGATTFQKKVRGYILCREYRDWLFAFWAIKYLKL
uniref:Uncharacterized protein n=1 Tax=Leptobrachium leishanense TaxID=445787 RepID=A0A8C5QL20_9ANUR